MNRKRSILAGFTDYTGVSLEDIIEHIRSWMGETEKAILDLTNYEAEVISCRDRLHSPDDILGYIRYFKDLFQRYADDFSRLVSELPTSVEPRHIEIINQIYSSSQSEERICIRFKEDHIATELKDESLRNILIGRIYKTTRGRVVDYYDLSNVSHRLEALLGTGSDNTNETTNHLDALELKPNLFGIGINFNYIFKKFGAFFKKKDS